MIEAPEKPINRKLTSAQTDLLGRIVRTNGGGLDVWGERRVARAVTGRK